MASFPLRLPDEVKNWVTAQAARSERSQNAEIVWILRREMAAMAAEQQREETGVLSGQLSRPSPASSSETPINDRSAT